MGVYLVRSSLPEASGEAVHAAVQRCRSSAEQLARNGHRVRHLATVYVAEDGYFGGIFEAPSDDVVRLATELAAIPYVDIVAAELIGPAVRPAENHHVIGGQT